MDVGARVLVLTSCNIGRWMVGEIGTIIENTYAEKYDFMVRLSDGTFDGMKYRREYYVYKEEIMDVSHLSDEELVVICKLLRLGVRKRESVGTQHKLAYYTLMFIGADGGNYCASGAHTTLRKCLSRFEPFGAHEVATYGQHPTKVPEINYP